MKKILAAVMFMVIMAAGAASAAPEYKIKVAYISSESHPTAQAMTGFAKDVDSASKGRIKVELYPNGQLGSDRELCEGVQMGTIQMVVSSTSALAGFDKRIQVLDLPYLFTTRKAAFDAVDGELGKKLNSYLEKKGFLVLGYQENGFRHVTNSKRPIKTPADLKGLKIRTMENPMHIAFFKELGANPTPMSWGELYTALQQGTVDAQENPYAMIDDGKFYEVQKYVSETGHLFSYEIIIANKKFMEKLPADLRKIVDDAAHRAVMAQRARMEKEEAVFKAKVTKTGLKANTLTPEQKKPFVDATKKVYSQFEKDLGKEIMDIAKKVQK
ncbi:DctP family TRAP transporter solute-binding subunit [Cloacibacillus evryensis]|uniref:DctP family TRAP transporter solute-binding subunit n=1 Tax=Cloacibacillus evryensis TaxID=508460 RepID=A0AAW5K571_9BACT|nr:DctP family TRAP transporter solute-binding subunit [Cloacibacillus evryensis]MCQ4815577.1 DctP family TRAP transporter solute-binding subunit [Cloacibacillus evryensis]MEA5034652.1 DctP family TRAP transporter solute-binding subunit [Cloacibacillus evryensis]